MGKQPSCADWEEDAGKVRRDVAVVRVHEGRCVAHLGFGGRLWGARRDWQALGLALLPLVLKRLPLVVLADSGDRSSHHERVCGGVRARGTIEGKLCSVAATGRVRKCKSLSKSVRAQAFRMPLQRFWIDVVIDAFRSKNRKSYCVKRGGNDRNLKESMRGMQFVEHRIFNTYRGTARPDGSHHSYSLLNVGSQASERRGFRGAARTVIDPDPRVIDAHHVIQAHDHEDRTRGARVCRILRYVCFAAQLQL